MDDDGTLYIYKISQDTNSGHAIFELEKKIIGGELNG